MHGRKDKKMVILVIDIWLGDNEAGDDDNNDDNDGNDNEDDDSDDKTDDTFCDRLVYDEETDHKQNGK